MWTRGPYDCSWILENIRSVFFYTCVFCILGLTTVQSLCCQIFVKSKGVTLKENLCSYLLICDLNLVLVLYPTRRLVV